MPKPTLSVIILNWNTSKLLEKCLKSVISATKIPSEIIVVDNGSTDGTQAMMKKKFPHLRLIQTHKNLGMGSGNNQGLKVASGEFLLILNTDTLVPPGALDKLVRWLEDHTQVGAVGPQLRYPNGKIQTSGGNFPNLLNTSILFLGIDDIPFISRFLPLYQRGGQYLSGKQKEAFSNDHRVDWLMGACLLLRRAVYDQVGGFDPDIFMYGEEVEWAYRIRQKGFALWYTPQVWITHFKGGSSESGLRGAVIGEMKGLIYFFQKHKPAWQTPVLRVILKVGSLGRIVLFTLLNRPELSAIYKEALLL